MRYKQSGIEYEHFRPPWPDSETPGLFLLTCSCDKWHFVGTAKEIKDAGHDDAPWKNHMVSFAGRVVPVANRSNE